MELPTLSTDWPHTFSLFVNQQHVHFHQHDGAGIRAYPALRLLVLLIFKPEFLVH
jgi:hypothetical protein